MASFSVTWKSDSKHTGKIFARKRQVKSDNKTIVISQKKLSLTTDLPSQVRNQNVGNHLIARNKPMKPRGLENKIKETSEMNFNNNFVTLRSTKLVKRKLKKDKLLEKLSADKSQNTLSRLPKQREHSLFSVGSKDVYVKINTKGKSVVEEVFSTCKKFDDLNIHKYIVSNLKKIGYTTLTNVQEKSIPLILSGKNVLVSIIINQSVKFLS